MEVAALALIATEQVRDLAIGIGTNIASEVLARMTAERRETTPTSFVPELRREMTDCVVSCLHAEPDPTNQQLLVDCLFDDLSIHDIVSCFLARDYDAANIVLSAKSRLPEGTDWEKVGQIIEAGAARLVERFKQTVSNNQVLFNRLAMLGWEHDERQAADIREIKNGIMQIQRSVADFPRNNTQGEYDRQTISSAPPLLSSAGEFPTQSVAAVSFLKDDFDAALNELKLGSAKKAKEGFKLVVERLEKLGTDIDRTLYFRAKSNLGLSTFASGGATEFAVECLERAFPFADGAVRGRINLALAKTLQDREEDAVTILSAILLEEPENFEALIHRGNSFLRLGRNEEALADFRKAAPKNRENQISLASALLTANAFDEAAAAARTLLHEHPDDPFGRIILSTAIGLPVVERANDEKLATGFRRREDLDSVNEAKALLDGVLPWLRGSDRPDQILGTLSNLAALSSFLGDHHAALAYSDEAAALPACGEAVHRNRFLAAVLTGQYEKALQSATALEAWLPLEEAVVRQVEAMRGLRRFADGLALVEKAREAAGATPLSSYLRVLEVDLTLNLPDIEKAEQLTEALNRDFPHDAIAWLSTAELAHQRNDPAEEEFLKKAIATAEAPGLRLQCRSMLGQYYGRTARWKESLAMLLPENPGDKYETPHRVRIAVCYFNLGRHSDALRMAKERLEMGYDAEACDLAIQSCLAMVELEKAKAFAELMQRMDERNQVAAWCFLAHLEFRLNRPEAARRILTSAISKQANSKLLLLLSNICLHLGRHEEAVSNAVRALEVADDGAKTECHLAIVHASLCLRDPARINRPLRTQIKKSHATLLRQKGSGFDSLPIEPDFAALRKMLHAQQKAASEGQRLFSEQGLPIYVLTYMAGRDIESVWRCLVGGNGLRVNMAQGSQDDQRMQHELAFGCPGVVLDATAILSFRHLGLLDRLPQMFGRVVVSFPLYEQFLFLLNEATHGPESNGWLGLVDDNLHLQEFEKGERERVRREFLAPIIAFMETVERIGFEEPREANDAGSFLKHCNAEAWSSVCVAAQTGLPLLCDDAGTLKVARMANTVEGFCTQTALRLGEVKDVITEAEYADAVVRLFESNYHFVSDDVYSTVNYLGRHGWAMTPAVRGIIERFDTGAVTRVSACRILGGILAHAWLRAPSPECRDRWVTYICERLRSAGDSSENFRTAFVGAIEPYLHTPDLFAGMIHAICRVKGLPANEISSIKGSAQLCMLAMGQARLVHLEEVQKRWLSLVRAII